MMVCQVPRRILDMVEGGRVSAPAGITIVPADRHTATMIVAEGRDPSDVVEEFLRQRATAQGGDRRTLTCLVRNLERAIAKKARMA